MRAGVAIALAVGLLLAAGAGTARAQQDAPDRAAKADKARAQKHLIQGDRHVARGDRYRKRGKEDKAIAEYELALAEFRAAYEAFPSPKIYYPIAQAEEKLGRDLDALHHYEQALAESEDLKDDVRAEIEIRIEEVKTRLGVVEFDVEPAGALITIDGEEVGSAPLPGPVPLLPGEHDYTVTHEGYLPVEGRITVEAGDQPTETVRLEKIPPKVEPPPEPEPEPPPPPPGPPKERDRLVEGLVLTGGLTAAAAVTGILALRRHGTFDDDAEPLETREAARDSGKALAAVSDVFLIGAVAAGAYTAYYYYKVYRPAVDEQERARRSANRSRPDVWLAPFATGEMGGVAVGGSF